MKLKKILDMGTLTGDPDVEILNEDMSCPLSFFLLASDIDKYLNYNVVKMSQKRILIEKEAV